MNLPFSRREDNLLSLRVKKEVTPEKPLFKAAAKKENAVVTKEVVKEDRTENTVAAKAPGKVINFNMTRTKEKLSNISNLLYKKPEFD